MQIKIKVYAGRLGLIDTKTVNPGETVKLHGIKYKYEEILEKNDEIVSMARFCGHQIEIKNE